MEKEIQGKTTPADDNQKVVEETTSEKNEGKTLSDVVGEERDNSEDTKESKKSSVFDDMMNWKKEAKESKKIIKEKDDKIEKLSKLLESKDEGDFKKAEKLAEKWDLPEGFVSDLKDELGSSSLEELKNEVDLLKREKQYAKLGNAIEKELSRVLTANPEYKEFCNNEAVKNYAKLNTNKSMEQIFYDLYGNLINKNNKNIEDYSSSGKNYKADINFKNPSFEDAKAISENEEFKDKYGNELVERIKKMS